MPGEDAPSISDASLLQQVRGGESNAATQLYLRYANRLRALAAAQTGPEVARRVDPDDIVQSVFRTFFRRVAKGEYDVPAGEELWKLFLVMGLNKVRAVAQYHKAAKRDVRQTTSTEGLSAPPATNEEDDLRVLQMTIDEMLAPLPATHREIITLRIAGHDVKEISEKTGRAKRSVERILQEFRANLETVLHGSD